METGLGKGIELNTNEETLSNYISPTITLVDNWHDWGFKGQLGKVYPIVNSQGAQISIDL